MKAVLAPAATQNFTLTLSMNAHELAVFQTLIGGTVRHGATEKQTMARNLHKLVRKVTS